MELMANCEFGKLELKSADNPFIDLYNNYIVNSTIRISYSEIRATESNSEMLRLDYEKNLVMSYMR